METFGRKAAKFPVSGAIRTPKTPEMETFKPFHQTNYLSSSFSPIIVLQIESGADIIQS